MFRFDSQLEFSWPSRAQSALLCGPSRCNVLGNWPAPIRSYWCKYSIDDRINQFGKSRLWPRFCPLWVGRSVLHRWSVPSGPFKAAFFRTSYHFLEIFSMLHRLILSSAGPVWERRNRCSTVRPVIVFSSVQLLQRNCLTSFFFTCQESMLCHWQCRCAIARIVAALGILEEVLEGNIWYRVY